jgi:hypothetical protein
MEPILCQGARQGTAGQPNWVGLPWVLFSSAEAISFTEASLLQSLTRWSPEDTALRAESVQSWNTEITASGSFAISTRPGSTF